MTVTIARDVEQALLRSLTAEEKPFVDSMLEYVEALISRRLPDVLKAAEKDVPTRVVLTRVVAEAAARVLRAPGGGLFKYETEGTYTYSVNSAVASGLLELTPRDWLVLKGDARGDWGTSGNTIADGALKRFRRARNGDVFTTFRRPDVDDPPPFDECGLNFGWW